jgi:hypothetical protein
MELGPLYRFHRRAEDRAAARPCHPGEGIIGGYTFLGGILWINYRIWPDPEAAMFAAADRSCFQEFDLDVGPG